MNESPDPEALFPIDATITTEVVCAQCLADIHVHIVVARGSTQGEKNFTVTCPGCGNNASMAVVLRLAPADEELEQGCLAFPTTDPRNN